MKEFQDNLANYLLGMPCDKTLIQEGLKLFPECKFDGVIYRGITSRKYLPKSEIYNQKICSWTTNYDVAYYFAHTYKYGYILKKHSNGYSINALLQYLNDHSLVCSDKLKKCSSKYEKEVLDELVVSQSDVIE